MSERLRFEKCLVVKEDFKDEIFGFGQGCYGDERQPEAGVTVTCSSNILKAKTETSTVDIHGTHVLGRPLSLCFGLVKKNAFYLYNHPSFFAKRIFQGGMFFYCSYKLTFGRQFYEYLDWANLEDGVQEMPFEISAENEAVHIGNTSGVWDITLQTQDTIQLAHAEIVFVAIDSDTRKPRPIPSLLPDIDLPKLTAPPRYRPRSPPDSSPTYRCQRRVLEWHIDANGHATYRTYLYMIMSCVEEAFNEGRLRELSRRHVNILSAKMDEFHVVFTGEANVGDAVDGEVWETDGNTVNILLKTRNSVINYASIKFSN